MRILILLLFINSFSFGQLKRFSFQIAGNYPLIANQVVNENISLFRHTSSGSLTSTDYFSSIREKYEGYMGINVKGFIDYQIFNKIFISGGLTIDYLRFKRSTVYESSDDGISIQPAVLPPTGELPLTTANVFFSQGSRMEDKRAGESTATYVQIPVLMGTSFFGDKLQLKAGSSIALLAKGTLYKSSTGYKDESADGFNNCLFNGLVDVSWQIKSIGINLNYQRSFSSIYDKEQSIGRPKFNILSLGVSYSIAPKAPTL
jgi:hypothetical protein